MSRLSQDQQKLIDSLVNPASNAVRLDAVNNKKHLKNPEFVKKYLEKRGLDLKYVAEKLKNDEEVVLTAVTQNGLALREASKALRDDEDVVIPAIDQNPWALQYASKALKEDIDVVLPALWCVRVVRVPLKYHVGCDKSRPPSPLRVGRRA